MPAKFAGVELGLSMILDSLLNAARYRFLSSRFARAFDYLQSIDPNVADGRYEIEGEFVYATVMSYETRAGSERTHEAHREYADIQLLLVGEEVMYYTPAARLGRGQGYMSDKDFEHFRQPQQPVMLHLHAGEFAVFFPGEGHRANLAVLEPQFARKIVVKVRR